MSRNFNKNIPDFVEKKNWQFVEMGLGRSHWRSISGAIVEVYPYYPTDFWNDEGPVPAIIVRPDGKTHNFSGEDAMERAWTIAEAFRKQEQ